MHTEQHSSEIRITGTCERVGCDHPTKAHGSYIPRYCSWGCRVGGTVRRRTSEISPRGTRISLTCGHCGGGFERTPSRVGAYCSRPCLYAAQAAGLQRTAEPARSTISGRRWAARRDPDRVRRRAHRLVAAAVARGDLARPGACEVCEYCTDRLHGHHDDYRRPLDVVWVCACCHAGIHQAERRGEIDIRGIA